MVQAISFRALEKVATGINGLDDILNGGIPLGRPTLLWGGPGCGKTLLAMEFLSRGVEEFGEPGLIVSFEESEADIGTNCSQFQFGFCQAVGKGMLYIEHIPLYREHVVEVGEYTFDAFLLRLEKIVNERKIRRLVLDNLDAIFMSFADSANLRFEYARIFDWLKERKITTLVTSGYSKSGSTPNFIQEHLVDCVIYLDHRLKNQISKRRLRVVKYRGSSHNSDEYPFLLGLGGLKLLPITSLDLTFDALNTTISTGIKGLDALFGGVGVFTGSATMISGGPGTGKTTVASRIAEAACQRGEKSLIVSFEESSGQILRNMLSVGIDLEPYIETGLLQVSPFRPGRFGLEEHLVHLHALVTDYQPTIIVLDPITSFTSIGDSLEIQSMLTRLLDYFKKEAISSILTSLLPVKGAELGGQTEVTSIVDNWIALNLLRERKAVTREIAVLKARGMKNINESHELVFSHEGIAVKALIDK